MKCLQYVKDKLKYIVRSPYHARSSLRCSFTSTSTSRAKRVIGAFLLSVMVVVSSISARNLKKFKQWIK